MHILFLLFCLNRALNLNRLSRQYILTKIRPGESEIPLRSPRSPPPLSFAFFRFMKGLSDWQFFSDASFTFSHDIFSNLSYVTDVPEISTNASATHCTEVKSKCVEKSILLKENATAVSIYNAACAAQESSNTILNRIVLSTLLQI